MALRAVPDHPKFTELKAVLRLPKGAVLGWLESVWHFTGRFTPHGNIGKYSDAAIESWVEWDGTPGALIAALLQTGWLDRSAEYRLLVHDWHVHADNATKLSVKRSGKPFCRADEVHTVDSKSLKEDEIATRRRLPVPEPVPGPEPVSFVEQNSTEAPSQADPTDRPKRKPPQTDEDFGTALGDVWKYYLLQTHRSGRYEFTALRRKRGAARLKDLLRRKAGGNLAEAVRLMKQAVDGLIRSDWHMGRDAKSYGKQYCEWESHLCPTFEKIEGWINQAPGPAYSRNDRRYADPETLYSGPEYENARGAA